jgi:hypothetical protein
MMQNSGPTGSSTRAASQGESCSHRPGVHADLAPAPALCRNAQQRPALRVEVTFAQGKRLLDAQPGAPEHDDQAAWPPAAALVGDLRMTETISSTVGGSAG